MPGLSDMESGVKSVLEVNVVSPNQPNTDVPCYSNATDSAGVFLLQTYFISQTACLLLRLYHMIHLTVGISNVVQLW